MQLAEQLPRKEKEMKRKERKGKEGRFIQMNVVQIRTRHLIEKKILSSRTGDELAQLFDPMPCNFAVRAISKSKGATFSNYVRKTKANIPKNSHIKSPNVVSMRELMFLISVHQVTKVKQIFLIFLV